jgi:hypothetical protein
MVAKLFKFMLAFIGVMASGPALAVLAILAFGVDVDGAIRAYPVAIRIGFGLYGGFVAYMFFRLQDVFIVFRPQAVSSPLSKDELVVRLEKAFGGTAEGKKLFAVARDGDRLAITWSASIDFVQLASAGGKGMKRVVVLTFDEKRRDVFFLMKDKDWGWDLSGKGVGLSLRYATGIFAEIETEYRPSIAIAEGTGLTVDLKKLSYNSNDLWMPIQTAVLAAGWTLRGGMVPGLFSRILFSAPMAMLFYLMAWFVTWLAAASPQAAGPLQP